MIAANVRPHFLPPWKVIPLRGRSEHEVGFGDTGVVSFDFEQGRVCYSAGEESVVIATLKASGGSVRSIQKFSGEIEGENFKVEVEVGWISGDAKLTVTQPHSPAAVRYSRVFFLRAFDFWQVLSCQYDELTETLQVRYEPEFERMAQVISAVLLAHLASGTPAT